MIDISKVLDDTHEVRSRMWTLWDAMQKGKAKGTEVRNQIAVANVILNGHKVDIAASAFIGSTPVVKPLVRTKHINGGSRRITS